MNRATPATGWVKNPDGTQGYTWNPITGCLNHANGMCKGGNFPCYAYRLANGRLRERYLANENIANPIARGTRDEIEEEAMEKLSDPFYPRFWPERLAKLDYLPGPDTEPKGKGIFVCDMSDLFGIGVPENWTRMILDVIKMPSHTQDRFYLLTKQPQNLVKFSPFPENCWVGVTATSARMVMQGCSDLEEVRAKVKFLSIEPLLEWSYSWTESYLVNALKRADINWLIIGSQTKPTVYPKMEWVRDIVSAADRAGIPVFLKDNLKPLLRNSEGWTPALFVSARNPDGTEYLRQEMPK